MNKLSATTLVIITLSLLIPTSPAFACTMPPGGLPNFTVAEHVNSSVLVVEGTVVAVNDVDYRQAATIEVRQYIKSSGLAVITVVGYGPSSVCLSPVYVGDHFIFYIVSDASGEYQAMYLSQFDAVAEASPENIAEAIEASGQPPLVLTPDALVLTQIAAFTTATPTPTPPSGQTHDVVAAAQATIDAAITAYSSDPETQSIYLTQAVATVFAAAGVNSGSSCNTTTFTTAEHVEAADVVFEGVVSSAVDNGAVIQVVEYLKVSSNPQVAVQVNFDKASPCYLVPQVGDHFIYFAVGDPALVMYALDTNGYYPIVPVDDANVEIISAASGQSPLVMQNLSDIQFMISATATPAPFVPTTVPYPTFPPLYPAPYTPAPAATPTAVEAVGLIGIGVVVGLILGGLGGIVIGVIIGRWRE